MYVSLRTNCFEIAQNIQRINSSIGKQSGREDSQADINQGIFPAIDFTVEV